MAVVYYLRDKQGDKSCWNLVRAQGCVILDRDGFTTKKQTRLSDICEAVPMKKVDLAAHCRVFRLALVFKKHVNLSYKTLMEQIQDFFSFFFLSDFEVKGRFHFIEILQFEPVCIVQ